MITTKANKMTGASALICIKLLPVIIEENRRRKIFLFLGEKDRKATFHSKKFGNNDVKKSKATSSRGYSRIRSNSLYCSSYTDFYSSSWENIYMGPITCTQRKTLQ